MKKLILLIGFLLMTSSAFADGFIVPEPWVPIAVKYHRVMVDIRGQATTTQIDQVFINDSDVENIEGTFLFPIPKGASFSAFTMYVDNEPYSAQIMDADSARAIYEEIVRRRKDPALLEYVGEETYRARIFPIPAHGEKQVVLSYDEIISYEGGLCRYVYPLNTEKFSSKPLEEVSVRVNLYSAQPIKSIYSPSHEIAIEKTDDHNAKITYFEEDILPDKDFILYYTVSTEEVGLSLVTYRELENDGFYLLLVSPKVEMEESEIARKRIIFVLDTSGSMKGDKIGQAKEAVKFCLNNLNDRDRFDIVDYNSTISKFRDSPVEATSEDIAAAVNYVDCLGAEGRTNINGALLTALALMEEDDFTNMIIFLTDGLPTDGPRDKATILKNVRNANQCRTRIFVFGVGFNVNTHLLDGLASENHGISTYVLPEEDIQFAVSSFYSKISDPVLSDLTLDFGSIIASDYYPVELPDLFQGSQLIQLGRYSGSGETTVTLSGQSGGTPEGFVYDGVQFPAENLEHEFIPRLWATRKIGYLLDQIRLYGFDDEIKDEIVALSKRYGIITPYTSFLILEDEPPPGTFDERLWTENTGEYAVRAADDTKRYGGAENVGDVQSTGVKYVGNKTFFLRDGFWTDSQYTQGEPTIDYEYGSEKYFSLLIGKPELGRYLAIGKNVVLCIDSQNYRILEETTAVEEEEETSQILDRIELQQNYPNPLNPNTTIFFTIPASAHPGLSCHLVVYNLLGQQVRTLVGGRLVAGGLKVVWDGKDDSGRDVPSGIYFYQLRIGDGKWVKTRKMVLMR